VLTPKVEIRNKISGKAPYRKKEVSINFGGLIAAFVNIYMDHSCDPSLTHSFLLVSYLEIRKFNYWENGQVFFFYILDSMGRLQCCRQES